MRVSLIVARDGNNGIGKEMEIPWNSSADYKHFSQTTSSGINNAVIMGRRTYESIGMPLPHRLNVVISSSISKNSDNITIVRSLDEALQECIARDADHAWICGGTRVYEAALLLKGNLKLDKCFITDIKGDWKCDTFFPEMDGSIWKVQEEQALDELAILRVFTRA
jgi:dihydrofolate reductase